MPENGIGQEIPNDYYAGEVPIGMYSIDFKNKIQRHEKMFFELKFYSNPIGYLAINEEMFCLGANQPIRPLRGRNKLIVPRYCPRSTLMYNLESFPNRKLGELFVYMNPRLTVLHGEYTLDNVVPYMLQIIES
ncbi:MAG TPA: hypothetical protein PKU78_01870 [Candidatus Dojkabacteria bacterium]|nr:hypothetical protein [Candidatus Dojkabacteria bacterium]HRO64943.1 hypothetical protein [Candidatus Dojkabacteria bacterium]HRP50728.1 hypothetical protein [Candidatus Dojkabacteria bacterium]